MTDFLDRSLLIGIMCAVLVAPIPGPAAGQTKTAVASEVLTDTGTRFLFQLICAY